MGEAGAGWRRVTIATEYRLPAVLLDVPPRLKALAARSGIIVEFWRVEARIMAAVPLMAVRVSCGFPSPADDYMDGALDFNELLITHPAATFAVRVAGDSMTGIGIFPGDIAIVDRSITARDGLVVLALLGDEFTIKRFRCRGSRVWLQAENPAYADIHIGEDSGFEVWGVVKDAIRRLLG